MKISIWDQLKFIKSWLENRNMGLVDVLADVEFSFKFSRAWRSLASEVIGVNVISHLSNKVLIFWNHKKESYSWFYPNRTLNWPISYFWLSWVYPYPPNFFPLLSWESLDPFWLNLYFPVSLVYFWLLLLLFSTLDPKRSTPFYPLNALDRVTPWLNLP